MIISGFYLYRKTELKLSKAAILIAHLSILNGIQTIIGTIYDGGAIVLSRIVLGFLPRNYFIITYSAVYLLSPFIISWLKHMTNKQFKVLIGMLLSLFSLWPFIMDMIVHHFNIDLYPMCTISRNGTGNGYTFVNYFLCFLIGASIRKLRVNFTTLHSAILMCMVFAAEFGAGYLYYRCTGKMLGYFYGYHNPIVIVMALTTFLFFKSFTIGSIGIVNFCAKATLTTYICGNSFLIRMRDSISENTSRGTVTMCLHLTKTCLIIFGVCVVIHYACLLVMKPVNKFLERIMNKMVIRVEDELPYRA